MATINIDDLIKFEETEKVLYASIKGFRFYITLDGYYEVWADELILHQTKSMLSAINYFNQKIK